MDKGGKTLYECPIPAVIQEDIVQDVLLHRISRTYWSQPRKQEHKSMQTCWMGIEKNEKQVYQTYSDSTKTDKVKISKPIAVSL